MKTNSLAHLCILIPSAAAIAQSPPEPGPCEPYWALEIGQPGMDGGVWSLVEIDNGGFKEIVAGGFFNEAGGITAQNIAKWNGASWSPVGGAMEFNHAVYALTVFDDGDGVRLYAGGQFGTPGAGVARWDGAQWATVGTGPGGRVFAILGDDLVAGANLYAGGQLFLSAGPFVGIQQWNGSEWSPLAGGTNGDVRAIAVHDDGTGPAIFVGGEFPRVFNGPDQESPVDARYVAIWNGTEWTALGQGMNDTVRALHAFDDGTGPALYAAGFFTMSGGVEAHGVAKWDGTEWMAVGEGLTSGAFYTLEVCDDGTGAALFAGGAFRLDDAPMADGVIRWNGESWSVIADDMDSSFVLTLQSSELDTGSGLFVGGLFSEVDSRQSPFIAEWRGCLTQLSGDFDGDGDVDRYDFAAYLNCYGGPGGNITLSCQAFDFDADEDVDKTDFAVFQRAFTGP